MFTLKEGWCPGLDAPGDRAEGIWMASAYRYLWLVRGPFVTEPSPPVQQHYAAIEDRYFHMLYER